TATGGRLFGNTSSAFGTGATSKQHRYNISPTGGFSFGGNAANTSGMFGTPASKPTGGLFSTPASTQGFGASSGFGAVFGQARTTSSTPFGTTTTSTFGGDTFTQQQSGTTVKFTPTTGSDTMVKSGVQSNITTKHQCITAMKEYEMKSMEELRVEDYLEGRKGPGTTLTKPASGGFNFGQQPSTSGSMFGSTAKPAFGTSSGGLFGTASTSTTGGLFQQSKPFQTTSAASGFSFGAATTTSSSLFGNTAKPAGSMFGNTAGGLFGSNTSGNTGFGAPDITPTIMTSQLFGNKTSGFGTTVTSSGFGGGLFGQPTATKPSSDLFSSSGGFGQNAGSTLFGGNKTGFGAKTTNTGSLFGNTALNTGNTGNKFGGFGNTGGGFGGFNFSAGANTGSTGGGFGVTTNAVPSTNQQSVEMLQTLFMSHIYVTQALLTAPFGDSPLFKNALSDPVKKKELLKPTNPIAQQAALQSPMYRVSPNPATKIKPKA
uniref:Nuclear pore complex protein Nup98-Nup96 n=1 Tax=Ciona intestinalis TaxID=7719 RepID=F6Q753_CIOIN